MKTIKKGEIINDVVPTLNDALITLQVIEDMLRLGS